MSKGSLIAAHLDRLETELGKIHTAVDSLRSLLDRTESTVTVEHRTTPAIPAVGIQQVVARDDVLVWWQGALGELRGAVRAQGLRATGPSGGLYASELFQQDSGLATVFIPVDGDVRAIGRLESFVVPAAELAVLTHHGSLEDLDIAYGQLGAYVATHEISIDGPLREHYLVDADDATDPEQWVTEIAWPIFRSDNAS